LKRAGSLLIPFIKELGIQNSLKLAEIEKSWYKLFGEPLCRRMFPSVLSEGELVLNVDSPQWLHELNFCKSEILQKLKPFGIRNVRFRLGRTSRRKTKNVSDQPIDKRKLSAKELDTIENALSQINDDALKQTVRKAMEKSFCRLLR